MCLCVLIPDLLGKSLQVLTSSSVLLQKLTRLQRTEALQRTGRVLQDEEDKEGEEEQVTDCLRLNFEIGAAFPRYSLIYVCLNISSYKMLQHVNCIETEKMTHISTH